MSPPHTIFSFKTIIYFYVPVSVLSKGVQKLLNLAFDFKNLHFD